MKKTLLSIVCLLFTSISFAQFAVGHTTITFNDPGRTGGFGSGGGAGRQIQTEIYYPANTAGSNVLVANGEFPVIVFGHGFVMTWDAYQNIWEEYVPKGYVVAFPRTEGSFSPNHNDFALDLALVEQRMQAEGNNASSLFYEKVKNASAIMGHSMGGGATILSGANNTSVKTIIGLAPAETNPSAIAAAASVYVPTLIFSGSQDGVTPPNDHHLPIYNAIAGDCKTYISITGGAHCYFANSNFNCDFGESTASSGISINRIQQQQTTYIYLTPWLDFYLNGNCDAFTTFENLLVSASGITSQRVCSYQPFTVSGAVTNSQTGADGAINLTITGGQPPFSYLWSNTQTTQDINNLTPGVYTVEVSDAYCTRTENFTVSGTPTSLSVHETLNFSVYPNPSDNLFFVSFSSNLIESVHIQLIDLSGKVVVSEWLKPGILQHTIHVEVLSPGFYILQVETISGIAQAMKLAVK